MDNRDLIGLILELFTWIGFGLAAVVLLVMLFARAAHGDWVETQAVIIDGPDGRLVRWMSAESTLHSRPLLAAEAAKLADPDEARVFYRRRDPEVARFQRTGDGSKTLRLLLAVTAGIALLASAGSIVLLFVP